MKSGNKLRVSHQPVSHSCRFSATTFYDSPLLKKRETRLGWSGTFFFFSFFWYFLHQMGTNCSSFTWLPPPLFGMQPVLVLCSWLISTNWGLTSSDSSNNRPAMDHHTAGSTRLCQRKESRSQSGCWEDTPKGVEKYSEFSRLTFLFHKYSRKSKPQVTGRYNLSVRDVALCLHFLFFFSLWLKHF